MTGRHAKKGRTYKVIREAIKVVDERILLIDIDYRGEDKQRFTVSQIAQVWDSSAWCTGLK